MAIKKRVFSIFLLFIFIVLICPIYILPVSAVTIAESDMPCSRPLISDNNGYLEILFKNDTSGDYFIRTYTWFTNPIGNNVGDTWVDLSVTPSGITVSPAFHIYDSSQVGVTSCGARLNWFMVTSAGYTLCGAFNHLYGDSPANSVLFASNDSSVVGYRFYGNARLVSDSLTTRYNFIVNYSETSTVVNKLIDLITLINQIESNTGQIEDNSYNIIDELIHLVNNTDSVEDKLQVCINYLSSINLGISDVNSELDRIESSVDDIETKLDKIIELLESNFDVEPPSDPNTESFEEHDRLEGELIGGDYEQQQDDVDVSVDSNASGFIWDTITKFLNSNPYVFGLFISILSISIIALLLNR